MISDGEEPVLHLCVMELQSLSMENISFRTQRHMGRLFFHTGFFHTLQASGRYQKIIFDLKMINVL